MILTYKRETELVETELYWNWNMKKYKKQNAGKEM